MRESADFSTQHQRYHVLSAATLSSSDNRNFVHMKVMVDAGVLCIRGSRNRLQWPGRRRPGVLEFTRQSRNADDPRAAQGTAEAPLGRLRRRGQAARYRSNHARAAARQWRISHQGVRRRPPPEPCTGSAASCSGNFSARPISRAATTFRSIGEPVSLDYAVTQALGKRGQYGKAQPKDQVVMQPLSDEAKPTSLPGSLGMGTPLSLCGTENLPAFDLTEHATKARAIRNLGHAVGDHRDRCPCPDHHCRRLVRYSMSYWAIVQTEPQRRQCRNRGQGGANVRSNSPPCQK